MDENPYARVARETYEKYAQYLLALNFTVLALAVQSATYQLPYHQWVFEAAAWATLLIAALAGLSAAGFFSTTFSQICVADLGAERLKDPSRLSEPVEEVIKRGQEAAKSINDHMKNMKFCGTVHTRAFHLGIILLVVSRALAHASDIFPTK